jgi:undecaprenyl-diphosphatase
MPEQKVDKPIEKIVDVASQAVRAESEPAPVRRYRAVLFQGTLILFAVGFALLTFLVKTVPSFAIDLLITKTIQEVNFPPFTWLMSLISWPGFSPQSVIITTLIILLIFGLGLHWEAVMALIAAVFSTAINVLVKDLIQRPRPLAGQVNVIDILNSYSFPSGHVMYYLGFYGFVAFLAFTLLKPSIKRSVIIWIIGVFVGLVGVSRIYLGQHWASDVLGAYLLASLTLVAIVEVYRWGKTRFFVHQPVAAAEPQPVKKATETPHAAMKR